MTEDAKKRVGSLPVDWEVKRLSEIGHLHCGQSPAAESVNYAGNGMPYVSGPEQWDGFTLHENKWTTKPKRIAPRGCLFITVKGAGVGKIFPGGDCAIGRDIYAFEPTKDMSPRFAELALKHTVHKVVRQARGDIPGLSKKDILDHEIPVPKRLQQDQIVSKIDELFSQIDVGEANLKRVQALVKTYRQSILKAAVTGDLTRDWREKNRGKGETGEALLKRILVARRHAWEEAELAKLRAKGTAPRDDKWKAKYKEPAAPDISGLPELPEGWVWASIDQLAQSVTYGSSAKCGDDSSGVPVLRMGNINEGSLDFADLKYLPLTHDEFPELHLQAGDLLFNRTNSAELVGKSAIFRGELEPCSFASYLIRVRFVEDIGWYVACFINSALGRQWIESVKSQQVGQANVNGSKLKALSIPLPPISEMSEIARLIDDGFLRTSQAEEWVNRETRRSMGLRRSVLASAFKGELLPQDPSDEPAAELLKRIVV